MDMVETTAVDIADTKITTAVVDMIIVEATVVTVEATVTAEDMVAE